MTGQPDRRLSDDQAAATGLTVSVCIEAAGWAEIGGGNWPALCTGAARAAWAGLAPPARLRSVSLDILLSDDAVLHDLNRRYRGIDRPTDVLSFPQLDPEQFDPEQVGPGQCDPGQVDPGQVDPHRSGAPAAAGDATVCRGFTDSQNGCDGIGIGDIAIALETVVAEAHSQGKDVTKHVAHLVVHGVLHLAGHDHEDVDEAKRMEALEVAILARLGIADPYADRPAVED